MSGRDRSVYQLYQMLWAGLDLVYPPTCVSCGKRGVRWCDRCFAKIQIIHPPVCEACGCKLGAAGYCPDCRYSRPKYTALRSWANFSGPVQQALHGLKYRRDISLGEYLSRPLIQLLSQSGWPVDIVVPVPLGLARQKERGYNQVAYIARPLALGLGWRYLPNALSRERETQSQVGLTIEQRRENVRDAFVSRSNLVAQRRVLLVDDVMTTGATIDACTSALLAVGAKEVYAITVARAI